MEIELWFLLGIRKLCFKLLRALTTIKQGNESISITRTCIQSHEYLAKYSCKIHTDG